MNSARLNNDTESAGTIFTGLDRLSNPRRILNWIEKRLDQMEPREALDWLAAMFSNRHQSTPSKPVPFWPSFVRHADENPVSEIEWARIRKRNREQAIEKHGTG